MSSQSSVSTGSDSDESRNGKPVEISNRGDSEINNPQPLTLKDKISLKLISLLEVERNIKVFLTLLAIGTFMIVISIFLIPFIITSPAKFSLCFGVGSLLILTSFIFYLGTKAYITKLFEQRRLTITLCFLLSIFIGIFLSFGSHYFLSILCSICQFVTLIMFVLSFLPGGECGIRAIKNMISSPFTNLFFNVAQS